MLFLMWSCGTKRKRMNLSLKKKMRGVQTEKKNDLECTGAQVLGTRSAEGFVKEPRMSGTQTAHIWRTCPEEEGRRALGKFPRGWHQDQGGHQRDRSLKSVQRTLERVPQSRLLPNRSRASSSAVLQKPHLPTSLNLVRLQEQTRDIPISRPLSCIFPGQECSPLSPALGILLMLQGPTHMLSWLPLISPLK